METGSYIRQRREHLGYSISELAERITQNGYTVEKQTLTHWERNRNNPPIESERFRTALALALNMSVLDFLNAIGFIHYEDGRSPEARLVADMVDKMSPEKRATAVRILENL